MIKLIIFDYDGVIVDSFPTVHQVYQKICKKLGKDCPSNLQKFKNIYGYNSRDLAKNLGFSEGDLKKADAVYREEIVTMNPALFDGIRDTIGRLKEKYKLVLISSSPRLEVMHKLNNYKISNFFDLIFASDETMPMRKPRAIKESLEKLVIKPAEAIMIGDRTIDFNEAVEAGLPSANILLVDYGWGYDSSKIPEYKPKMIIRKPIDILDAIAKLN